MSEFRGRDGQTIWQICAIQMHSPGGSTSTGQYKTFSLILVNLLKHNQNYYLTTWHFDLYQRPSSEEAGTQFFQFLTQREDAVSTQPKRTMSSTGLKRRWSTESQSVLPDGSKRPYTSEMKDNRPRTVMRAATNWATHTTTFLTQGLPVVSRIFPSCQESEELSTSFFW